MNLYRYMPFEIFIDIVVNEKLTLLSPSLWDDSYEGWFWKLLKESNKVSMVVEKFINSIYAQCWSKDSDSIPLWSIYSYENKAIMIETSQQDVEKLPNVYSKEIEYSEDASITIDNEFIEMILSPTREKILMPYTKKRSGFIYENEVRIFAMNFDNKGKSLDIPISNIHDFIKNIMVHPFANEWYVNIIKSVCEKHGLPFGGRSTLYDM